MTSGSGLYVGRVTHARLSPRRHRLAYRVFYLLVDLDHIAAEARGLRWLSLDRFNLLSFHGADHLEGGTLPLRSRVDRVVARAGLDLGGGRVRLLCMPRMLGHAFNPLSVYFCHGNDGALACMIYEVNNTFGQRHSYVVPVAPGDMDPAGGVQQSCAKRFYVSPFMDMDLLYRFRIAPPAERVSIAVTAEDHAGPVIATAFSGAFRPLTDRTILAAAFGHPLLGLKVLAGIHWEALRIWLKGIRLRDRPAPPEEPVTVAAQTRGLPTSPW